MVFNSGRAKWVDNMRAGTRGPRLAVADGPSQGTWAGSAPVAETDPYEESIRKQLMAQQLRSAELQNQAADQQLSSQWEAERAQMFHPYDTMPMDRMALDKHSPLYQNEGDPQIQMDMEPSAGAWGASAPGMASPMAPERFDMPEPERVGVGESQWDAAMSKTNLGKWNNQDTRDTREFEAILSYYGSVVSDPLALPDQKKAASDAANALIAGRKQPEGPQPFPTPKELQKKIDQIKASNTGAPAGAMPRQSSFTPDQEQDIQDNMNAYGRKREEVVAALRAAGKLP